MTGSMWRLPGYVVEDQLGIGGSGQVWRARERSTGQAVAVKLLPVVERAQLAAVRSEAAMLSGLAHPHLLHLREVVSSKVGLALVLDLAAGGSLAALLSTRGRLTPGEVVTTIAPIGAALAYAHNAGVVHGDVSAANLLFTDVGLPVLADLGVARLSGDDSPVSSTPAYIDPAVAVGSVPAAASDVFMLGAVALHALTGEPPWPGSTSEEVLAAAAAGQIGDLTARLAAAGVPSAVADVVMRALEFDADRRLTAAEFALDLRYAAEPVAVELAAGRVGRHAVDRGERSPVTAAARPAFTHALQPPPRRPVPTGLRSRFSPTGRRVAFTAGVLSVLIAVATAAVLWWPGGAGAGGAGAGGAGAGGAGVSDPQGGSTMTAAVAGQVLAGLDATRAQAFAQRDPSLLAQVYARQTLREQDSSMITQIVPDGCGLHGVRTDYADVTIGRRTSTQVVLSVQATLRPSTLECAGARTASAPGAEPAPLTIVLVRSGSRYLIDTISR